MIIKAIYRKNLRMSEGKVAAQIAHAVKNLGNTPQDSNIVVLKVSDKKFEELTKENPKAYIQYDKGLTEVEPNTPTAAAWIVEPEYKCTFCKDIQKIAMIPHHGNYKPTITDCPRCVTKSK